MRASELREMTGEELLKQLDDRQKDLITFRINRVTGVVENVRAIREARRDIARIKTILNERELAAAAGNKGTK